MISNWVSLITSFVELFLVSGICFGFTILQYLLEDEQIFYKEKCGGEPVLGETVLCQEAKEYYNLVFTCCIISSVGLLMDCLKLTSNVP